jgi:hypothetical protein
MLLKKDLKERGFKVQNVRLIIDLDDQNSGELNSYIRTLAKGQLIHEDRKMIKELLNEIIKEKENEFREKVNDFQFSLELKNIMKDEARKILRWNNEELYKIIYMVTKEYILDLLSKERNYLFKQFGEVIKEIFSDVNYIKELINKKDEKEEKN